MPIQEPPFTPTDDPTDFTYDEIQSLIDNYILYKTLPSSISNFDVADVCKAILDYAYNGLNNNPNPNTYMSTIPNGIAMTDQVGEIAQGTFIDNLRGLSFSKLFDILLFKITPTFIAPSAVLHLNPTDILYEIGIQISFSGGIVFDPGSILQPWNNVRQGDRSGAITGYYVKTPTASAYTLITDSTFNYDYTFIAGKVSFLSRVDYAIGPQPLDIAGNPSNTPLPASSVFSTPLIVEGVYPIFGATVSLNTQTKQPLVSMVDTIQYSLTLVAESIGSAKQSFQVPVSFAGKTITKIEYYNPISQSYDNVNRLSDFTTSTIIEVIQGVNVNYTNYVYNNTTRGAITIRLTFS